MERLLPLLRGLLIGCILCVFAPTLAWARGGGGCLEEGTPIATPSGLVPIEKLKTGDRVWTFSETQRVIGTVKSTQRVTADAYIEISIGTATIRATPEHPFQTAPGVFRTADKLNVGDSVLQRNEIANVPRPITSIKNLLPQRPAYNLLVTPGGTYIANGFIVHNKGCFLPDTPITRADGTTTPIGEIRPGDELLAFTVNGEIVRTTVRNILIHEVDEYRIVTTPTVQLHVTAEHPFFVGDGTFKTLESLRVGDSIFVLTDNQLRSEPITGIEIVRAPTRVYNLQTDRPNTYFAQGVAVHNKGGSGGFGGGGGGYHGGGGYYGGSSSSSPGIIFWAIVFVIVVIVLCNAYYKQTESGENLDYVYSPSDVRKKADKTKALLDFIAKVDESMTPDKLEQKTLYTFTKLQLCWESRDYTPMKPLLMPYLYNAHLGQIRGLIRNHEINKIAGLHVDRIDLVNLRYPHKASLREFTTLVTATATDYYIDDRTSDFLRGDESPAQFQEFWTFQFHDGSWLLREIEQSRDSSVLREENFFEPFTDMGRDQVYGEAAGKSGPAGPWVASPILSKDTKIQRLLNFLVQTDKIWNRDNMLELVRNTFTQVILARESNNIADIPDDKLFPDVAASLKAEMTRLQDSNSRIEFRNLCVRKVDLILVRNFADNSKDEFVARISAHAQRGIFRDGQTVMQEPDVSPFTEYWTFGRLDNQWKVREVLPPAKGESLIEVENLDEDSTPDQLKWYYSQTRAI
jgi:hypothetical protein